MSRNKKQKPAPIPFDEVLAAVGNACAALAQLLVLAEQGGPLPARHAGLVRSRAKWLKNALGLMIHDSPSLRGELAAYAIEPPPTDEELDRRAEALDQARNRSC